MIVVELTTKQKGNITELQCAIAFINAGFKVSIPYGEDCKYDMIVDKDGNLYRIQCKTSRALPDSNEGFKFNTRSVVITTHGAKESRYTRKEIDYFATVYEGNCYLVPVEECGCEKVLRFCYPPNGQKKNISLAVNYTLENMMEHFK